MVGTASSLKKSKRTPSPFVPAPLHGVAGSRYIRSESANPVEHKCFGCFREDFEY